MTARHLHPDLHHVRGLGGQDGQGPGRHSRRHPHPHQSHAPLTAGQLQVGLLHSLVRPDPDGGEGHLSLEAGHYPAVESREPLGPGDVEHRPRHAPARPGPQAALPRHLEPHLGGVQGEGEQVRDTGSRPGSHQLDRQARLPLRLERRL